MGKGKKFKNKKEESKKAQKEDGKEDKGDAEATTEEVTAPITVSESQPSTSAQTAEAPPSKEPEADLEEEFVGLGLGKSKKKKKKKPAAAPASKETTPVTTEAAAPVEPVKHDLAKPPVDVKPQPQAAQQSAPPASYFHPQATPGYSSPVPPGFPPPPGLAQNVPGPARPDYPGVGRGRGQNTSRPVEPHNNFPSLGQTKPWQGGSQPGVISTSSQQQHQGAGRGRGRGQETPQPRSQPAPPASYTPVPHTRAPTAPYTSVPHVVTSHGDTRKPEVSSRFKIPDKVIGRNVAARRLTVLANYLPMKIKPLPIYRYDVTFKPDKPKKMIPKAFTIVKGRHFTKSVIAFDQMKNCYSLTPLPNVPETERFVTIADVVDNNGRIVKFEVSFKATGVVNLGTIIDHMKSGGSSLNPPTEAIQCVDVILRQGTLENYVKAGRQFFKRPERPIDLGDGLEMWTGLFQSAIFTCRPFVNIDVAHKGFPKNQPLIQAMQKDFQLDLNMPVERQRGRGVESFMMFVKNLRVMASIGGDCSSTGQRREFICNELVDPPSRIMFTMTDQATGKETKMSVAEYFAKVKNVRLNYPNLNCMWVGPRDKKIYYPLELLEVAYGQALNKQLNDMQLSTMVRTAATPPDERKRKIEEVIRDMNYSRNTYFKQFGLEIEDKFLEVEAKVLNPPELDIGGQRTITPSKGAWQANRLLKPEPLSSWAIVSIDLDAYRCKGEDIVNLLKSAGSSMGMSVSEPLKRYYGIDMRRLREVFSEAVSLRIRFLVIVVPTRGRDYYHKVKQVAEREVGILTQCIKEYTATRKLNIQTAKNILLKVNAKLMGINQAIDKRSTPLCLANGGVMIVGADVTHPSPDQTSVPSIAAVTASFDAKCSMYNIQLSIQTPKKEMIVEFEDMMVEHLKVYIKNQGGLPKKIFVFRDGVSEGQFQQVMNSELQAVHRAYERMSGHTNKPEVLFLLVQKRHHTRFFHNDARRASYNVEPGTVVDTHIVHARELDFYLVSHQAIKGTARPTRYHAVCNDGNIPHDEVEQLTYYLCHLYTRCMRAVSYPTPTYYAHLACLRARSLTFGERFNNQDLEKKAVRLTVLDKMLDSSRMFFV